MRGVYCALSWDEGASWESRRPITANPSLQARNESGSDGAVFRMSYNETEPAGYMAAAVSDDGIITLITSRNSYSFNLAWLRLKPPPGSSGGAPLKTTDGLPNSRPSLLRMAGQRAALRDA